MARNRTRAERRQAKILAQERQAAAIVLPAASIASAWILIEREFLKRPPYLLGYQAASLRARSEPLYYTREDFTIIY